MSESAQSPLAPASHDSLRELLREIFGSHAELVSYRVANQRPEYLVLLAELQYPSLQVAIKIAGPGATLVYPFERTAMLHTLVRAQTTLPLPEVIAWDASVRRWPWRYLITAVMPGHEWARVRGQLSRSERRGVYRSFGRAVAELHGIRFAGFGELTAEGEVVAAPEYVSALMERAQLSIRSPRQLDRYLALIDRSRHLFADVEQARLCHEDLHGYNVLVDRQEGRWQITAILDFDKSWAGHREIDLARLDLWTGMTGEGFWPAYESRLPRSALYPQRRPFYQLLWCLEYAVPSRQHLADTARVCRVLDLPPILDFT